MATVRPDHPRIWLNNDTLPALKARAVPTNDRWLAVKAAGDTAADWNSGIINPALCYLLTGNGAYAAKAFELMSQSMAAGVAQVAEPLPPPGVAHPGGINEVSPDSGYQCRNYFPASAIVYDWCYSWLNAQQKQQLRTDMETCTDWVWPETNPSRKGAWAVDNPGNNYFHGFMLTWLSGLALFGDSPKAPGYLDLARQKWDNLVVSYLHGPAQGGLFPEGTGYGTVSLMEMLQYLTAHQTATGEDLLNSRLFLNANQFFVDAVTAMLHLTNPAMTEIAPIGDLGAGPIADRHRIAMLMLAGRDPRATIWLDSVTPNRVSQRINAYAELLWYPGQPLPTGGNE